MIKRIFFANAILLLGFQVALSAHCQMPCGIYHDDMVYDQIDQYVETMVKADTILNQNKFSSAQEKNVFIRWVMQKDKHSDQMAELFTSYFLQQKIKPEEEDTVKRLVCVHRLLFLLVKIKQTADISCVNDFYEEWEKFKLMFHVEGYSCKMEQIKMKQLSAKRAAAVKKGVSIAQDDEHDHEHEHDDDDHEHSHSH
jgi:nickel superoxide dismutase